MAKGASGTSSRGVEGGQGRRSPHRPGRSPGSPTRSYICPQLCSLHTLHSWGLVVTHPKLRRMEDGTETGGKKQTQTSVDNHDSRTGISLFCWHLSDTNKTCKMQNFLPASSSNAWFFLLHQVGCATAQTVELLSTQECKSIIDFPHFLSNFAFQNTRYDFIFKMKFCRSLAHND